MIARLLMPLACLALAASPARAAKSPPMPTALPEVGLSVVRLFGALALVLAVFFGGVWLFRNWQRLMVQQGRSPKLNVLEVRSLGHRHALYVVGYEDQRLLVSTSPTGVTFLSHLPVADGKEAPTTATPPLTGLPFAQTLQQLLTRK